MHLVIYGPEGSGKGTQAQLLGKRLALAVFTAGDLVREAAQHDTGTTGKACRKALTSGTYVEDTIMCKLLEGLLKKPEIKGFILDGFPRTHKQAQFLWETFSKLHKRIDKVIYLFLTNEESIKRLLSRNRKLFEGSSQSHDSRDRIKRRLLSYRSAEKILISFFEKKNVLLTIQGGQTPQKVFTDILQGLAVT